MKTTSRLILTGLLTSLTLTACNKAADLPTTALSPPQTTGLSPGEQQLLAALPKVLSGLETISRKIDALQGTSVTVAGQELTEEQAVPAINSSTPVPGKTPPAPAKPITSQPPTTSPTQPSLAEKSQTELKNIMSRIKNAAFVELSAEKTERNLDTGKVSVNVIKMWQKQPNTVKIDIIKSSSGSTGVKALYTSGEGDKIKVRPAGALSFITTDLDKTDDRVVSNNGYLSDDIDLVGVARRFSQGYTPELVGTTQLNGSKINILKLTAQGTNSLDARISYEYLGYEPGTYNIRLWEIYDAPDAKEPYYRMALNSISFPTSLPDSAFKL